MSTQEQEPLINACPECGEGIDVSDQPPYAKIECPHCHSSIRVRTQLGQYQVQRLLGEGGMSQVFLARDETLGRSVALKVLHKELSLDDKLTESFEREAKITASINHPNVVKVYTVGSDYGYFFIAMELVDNMSLEELITNQANVDESKVMQIAHDVTSGLFAAFKAGLIHRDIKPGNILLANDGSAKLVDFGLAVQSGHHDADEDVWATPFYVPPEKLDGEPDDFRGDIYSLGATLFHAVSGTPPYAANTASLDELKAIKAKTIRLIETAPDSRKGTCRLIDRMMARKPDDRHQNYEELLSHIDDVGVKLGSRKRSSSGIADLQSSELDKEPIWKKKPVMIAAAIVLVAGISYAFYDNRDAELSDALLSGGDDRVLTAGQQSSSTQYVEARKLLSEGQVSEAEKGFQALLKAPDLKEPTRSWAKFNLGLCLLLNSEEKKGRKHFLKLTNFDKDESLEEDISALLLFFGQTGNALSDSLPVRNDALSLSGKYPYEKVAFLAFGLKNWHQSNFDSSMRFFRQFKAATFPEPYAWIEGLKTQVTDFSHDGKILGDPDLPNPRISMSEADLQKAKTLLKEAKAKLKTPGPAPQLLDTRIARIPELIKEKKRLASLPPKPTLAELIAQSEAANNTPPPPGNTGPMNTNVPPTNTPTTTVPGIEADAEGMKELQKLWKAEEIAQAFGANFKFQQEKSWYEGVSSDLPMVKEMLEDELKIVNRAELFLGLLLKAINESESKYEGEVIRKEGAPLEATVTGATREILKVNLGFGDNEVAIEEFEAAWLLKVAGELFNNADNNPELLGSAICFAWATGEQEIAHQMAKDKGEIFPEEFKAMWIRLMENRPR